MFEPAGLASSELLRYGDRNRVLGMDVDIWRNLHPLPVMTVNEKAYAVTLREEGWRKTVNVYADVGARQYEKEWFDALQGRVVTLANFPGSLEGVSEAVTLRIKKTAFGRVHKIVVGDNGRTDSHTAHEGRLELRETWPSFVSRQMVAVLENSFLIVATAFATGLVTLLLTLLHGRLTRRY